MKPLVSVLVVNWNGSSVLKGCLESLSRIDYPNWELVLVDNGSTDNSLDLVNELNPRNLKVIKNGTNLGFAEANNQAYKISKGKYVLLLNNDTKVRDDFLSKLVEFLETDHAIGVVQPKIFLMDKPTHLDNAGSFLTYIGFLSHWGFMKKDGKEFDSQKKVFATKGACMLIRREVIEKGELFDPDFNSYFEESDFCWRVWLLGYSVFYYPKAYIYHKLGFTIKRLDVSSLNFHYYKNRISSLIKNLSTPYLFLILPLHIIISLGIAVVFLFRGRFRNSLIIFNAILWNLANINETLKKRKKIQKIRKVSDKFIFQSLSVPVDWKSFFGDFKRVEKDLKNKT